MWETRWVSAVGSPTNVVLTRRDPPSRDELTFVIPLDDWWNASATQLIADGVLQEEGLNFRAIEVYGIPDDDVHVWTTNVVLTEDRCDVELLRDRIVVAVMSLDDWAETSTTQYIVDDTLQNAHHLALYGDDIDEATAGLARETN